MDFHRPDIIRPPSEAKSYFLPLTEGCSNSTCTFCNYYFGTKLRIRELEDVKKEVDAVSLYLENGIRLPNVPDIVYLVAQGWDGRDVFLQDGDALVYPFADLVQALRHLNHKIPGIRRIAAYATAQDILRRSVSELEELRKLKLGILYVGIESGDEEVLRKINKNVNYEQLVEAGKKVKEAGITLSVTIILGLGGKEGSTKHARATARILSEIDPEYAGALTLTLMPNTPLYHEWKQGKFTPISPFESLEELATIIENSNFTNCYLSSTHASNYFSIRGMLPGDKVRMINEIRSVLEQKDPSLLRPEIFRGL